MARAEDKAEKQKRVRPDKNKIVAISITVAMCLIAAFSLFVLICSFLPVKRFELSGITQYDKAQIISESGIALGDKLYSVDIKETEERLMENCTYIDEVYVERKFPNKIVIRVVEKVPQWYIEVSGSYYSLDSGLVIIEETVSNEKFKAMGIAQLKLPNVRSLILGELPEFGADETELKKALELISAIQQNSLKPRLTLVDMESRFDVNLVVDGKYNVYMGDIFNTEEKLAAVQEILKSGKLKELAGADIDASVPETVSVKPIYDYEE